LHKAKTLDTQDKTTGYPVHDNKNNGTPYFMALHKAKTLGTQDKTTGYHAHDNKNNGTPYFTALHKAKTLGTLKFDKLHFLVRFSD